MARHKSLVEVEVRGAAPLASEIAAFSAQHSSALKDPGQNYLYIRLFLSGCRCVAILGNSPAIACESRLAATTEGHPRC